MCHGDSPFDVNYTRAIIIRFYKRYGFLFCGQHFVSTRLVVCCFTFRKLWCGRFSYLPHPRTELCGNERTTFWLQNCQFVNVYKHRRSQWQCGLSLGSAAARLLGLWVRIPSGAWMSVSCECCVLSGRVLCDKPVPRPEESYRMWCV
jgi:hypothetical protein